MPRRPAAASLPLIALILASFSAFSCVKRNASSGKYAPAPRAALVLPSGTRIFSDDPAFRGFYAEAERRKARLEAADVVYGFGDSAVLRAEAPLPGGADSAQIIAELAAWDAELVILSGTGFSETAVAAALEYPGIRFVALDASPPVEEGEARAPRNLSYARIAVEEAAFVAGAFAGAVLAAGGSGAEPRAGSIRMAEDEAAREAAIAFGAGFAFALGKADAAFDQRSVAAKKSWNESLGRLMKPSTGAVLVGKGPFRPDALELAGTRGVLVVLADDDPVPSGPEPLARAVKRQDAAAARVLSLFLDGGDEFRMPVSLGISLGCVEMRPGKGYEAVAAPHAGLLARAGEAASSFKPESSPSSD